MRLIGDSGSGSDLHLCLLHGEATLAAVSWANMGTAWVVKSQYSTA
jgi:hypothetical protein